MVRSNSVQVLAAKIPTALDIQVDPTSGVPPFNAGVTGQLYDPATMQIVGGKTVNILLDGVVVASALNEAYRGFSRVDVPISTVGTHTIQAEFLGDGTYEGCEPKLNLGSLIVPASIIAPALILLGLHALMP